MPFESEEFSKLSNFGRRFIKKYLPYPNLLYAKRVYGKTRSEQDIDRVTLEEAEKHYPFLVPFIKWQSKEKERL